MDDWTLGIKQRQRWSFRGWRTFKPVNAKAPVDLLGDVHTVLLIDDSGSMAGHRWHEARNLIKQIGPLLARYANPDYRDYSAMSDEDYVRSYLDKAHSQGFDLHFLNHVMPEQGLRTAEDQAREQNYHRDFRVRRQAARRLRQQLEWQVEQQSRYYY